MQEALTYAPENMNHYLTVNDVADLLNLQRETIYKYCKENFLPHVKFGTTLRFDPKQIAAWVHAHQFAAGGNLTDKTTDWVIAHMLDRTLNLPIPALLQSVLKRLPNAWLADARKAQLATSPEAGYSVPLQVFRAALDEHLSLLEQRELLAELMWLEVYIA